jgi:hypothetical protein
MTRCARLHRALDHVLDCARVAGDAWQESEHPREEAGKFTGKGARRSGEPAHEQKPKMTRTDLDVNSLEELKRAMKQPQFMDGRAHLVVEVFGLTHVYSYPSASKIPISRIGNAEWQFGGYFQNGEVKPFSHAARIAYQNSCLGRE